MGGELRTRMKSQRRHALRPRDLSRWAIPDNREDNLSPPKTRCVIRGKSYVRRRRDHQTEDPDARHRAIDWMRYRMIFGIAAEGNSTLNGFVFPVIYGTLYPHG